MRKHLISKEQIETCVADGLSLRQICVELNTSQTTVIRALRRHGLKTIVKKAHPDLDIRYFECIDTKEKAYWLGFLYADGCVKFTGKIKRAMTLVLELATKDEDQIDRFCDAIRANKQKKSYCTRKGKYHAVAIRICGEFVKHLAAQGCTPNKTFRIVFPWFDKEELDLSFLLGFYDGDGTAGGGICCGNIPFLKDIAERHNIDKEVRGKPSLGTLSLPAPLKRRMFANYPNSMLRKRIIYKPSVYKRRANVKPRIIFPWPTNGVLSKLIWEKPMGELAIQLGLKSGNTVKKRCIEQGIVRPPKAYWTRRSKGYSHEESLLSQFKPRTGRQCLPKLTVDQVREIRRLLIEDTVSLRGLARMFHCGRDTINNIRDGISYRSII